MDKERKKKKGLICEWVRLWLLPYRIMLKIFCGEEDDK
jgi:hypothetical protein